MGSYRRADGRSLVLTETLGVGGEGSIFAVRGEPGLAAKIYTSPSRQQELKLRVMVAHPPVDPAASVGHVSIAWPRETLSDARGRVVGFLMPRIDSRQSVSLRLLANPTSRRHAAPGFTWRYLLRTARNLTTIVHAVHSQGYVVGDLNESNLLVRDTALLTLVDCDSLQVPDARTGRVFRCPVGLPEYTPPELHGCDFWAVDRLPEHDSFGLAVLIYLLLMEGAHPFDGRWRGDGIQPTLKENIQRGCWVGAGGRLLPPAHALPFSTLPPELRALFERCFGAGQSEPTARPTPAAWLDALDRAENGLVECGVNARHVYGGHRPACPWCERVRAGLPDPFPAAGRAAGSAAGGRTARPPVRIVSPRPFTQPRPFGGPARPAPSRAAQPATRPTASRPTASRPATPRPAASHQSRRRTALRIVSPRVSPAAMRLRLALRAASRAPFGFGPDGFGPDGFGPDGAGSRPPGSRPPGSRPVPIWTRSSVPFAGWSIPASGRSGPVVGPSALFLGRSASLVGGPFAYPGAPDNVGRAFLIWAVVAAFVLLVTIGYTTSVGRAALARLVPRADQAAGLTSVGFQAPPSASGRTVAMTRYTPPTAGLPAASSGLVSGMGGLAALGTQILSLAVQLPLAAAEVAAVSDRAASADSWTAPLTAPLPILADWLSPAADWLRPAAPSLGPLAGRPASSAGAPARSARPAEDRAARPTVSQPVWVQNHQLTEMWSAPAVEPTAQRLATTSGQFCAFLVVDAADPGRLYVYNPLSRSYFWIDREAVGPADPPARARGARPAGENCAPVDFGD